jgi:hypothetical protein
LFHPHLQHWNNHGAFPRRPNDDARLMGCFPEQIGNQLRLRIRCKACGHAVTWSTRKAIRLLGYSTGPVQAAETLRCSKCDAIGQVAFT